MTSIFVLRQVVPLPVARARTLRNVRSIACTDLIEKTSETTLFIDQVFFVVAFGDVHADSDSDELAHVHQNVAVNSQDHAVVALLAE